MLPFLKDLKAERGRLALGTTLLIVSLLAAIGLLGLSGWLITAAAVAGLSGLALEVYRPSAGIRFFAIARTVARYFERLVHHDAVLRALARLRGQLFRALAPVPLPRLARLRRSELLNRMTADVEALDNLYLRIVGPTLAAAVTIVLTVGVLIVLTGPLGWTVGAVLAIGGVLLPATAWRLGFPHGEAIDRHLPALRGAGVDAVQGLAELRAGGALERQERVLMRAAHGLAQARARAQRLTGLGDAAVGLLGHAALLAALLSGIPLYQAGEISGPILALAALAALAAGEALSALPGAWQQLGRTRAAARRLLELQRGEVVDEAATSAGALGAASGPTVRTGPTGTEAVGPDATATPAPSTAPAAGAEAGPREPAAAAAPQTALPIRFDKVDFRHHTYAEPILEQVDLHIAAGEQVVVYGPSGSGKSTLLDLIAGFIVPQGGTVYLGERASTAWPEAERFGALGYLTQRTELFADTVAANLRLAAPQADDQALWAALQRVALDQRIAANAAGLEAWVGEGGAQLSGGEARRLALARVVLTDAPVVLLDEPFRGLDDETAATVCHRLEPWLQGRTVLIVSHAPEAAPAHQRRLAFETLQRGSAAAPL
nr:ATP-binding cassette domain-containing protein [Halorhodospira abdelmalekii]